MTGVTQRLSELAKCSCFFSLCSNHQGVQVKPAPSDDRMWHNGQHAKDTVKTVFVLFSCSGMSYSLVTLWSIAHQAPLSTEFSRQQYWNELPFPSPGDVSNLGVKPAYPPLQMDSLLLSQ